MKQGRKSGSYCVTLFKIAAYLNKRGFQGSSRKELSDTFERCERQIDRDLTNLSFIVPLSERLDGTRKYFYFIDEVKWLEKIKQ